MESLRLFHLGPSPNCIKARVALGFKGVPYEAVAVDPQDRAPVVEATGQPLTPALTHGGVKLFDSGAILRYVDANFAGPPLFAADRDTMRAIEDWEMHGRAGMRASLGAAYTMAFGGIESTQENIAKIREEVHAAAATFEGRLVETESDWLVDDRLTAADVTCASIWCYFAGLQHPALRSGPFGGFIGEHFGLGADFPRMVAWVERTAAFDAWLTQPA